MSAPYDPFPFALAVVQLLLTPEGRAWLQRKLDDAGVTQDALEAKAKEIQPPDPPA